MYEVKFEDNEIGRQRYEMAFQAVALTQKQVPVSEWDDVVDLIRKLKEIGDPAKESIGATALYNLCEGGGTVLLEKGEMKALIDFVGQPIWRPLALENARELKKWLESLEHQPGSLKSGPPQERRRGKKQQEKVVGSINEE